MSRALSSFNTTLKCISSLWNVRFVWAVFWLNWNRCEQTSLSLFFFFYIVGNAQNVNANNSEVSSSTFDIQFSILKSNISFEKFILYNRIGYWVSISMANGGSLKGTKKYLDDLSSFLLSGSLQMHLDFNLNIASHPALKRGYRWLSGLC